MNWKTIRKWVLLGLPFVLGTLGYVLSGTRFLDALFMSICLYALGVSDTPPNLLVEIARWTAPIATAGGILALFVSLRERARNAARYRRGNSVAVYGPAAQQEAFLEKLGERGIPGGTQLVKAQQYVLLGAEEENLEFYRRNRAALSDREVYLLCSSVRPQAAPDARLRLFSAEEAAARLYWKQHCLYPTVKAHGFVEKIVLIGFGKLGEELLTCALQDNLFLPAQQIEYHVFGETVEFEATHPQLRCMEDRTVFHPEPWYQALPLIEEAGRVLVLQQQDQTALVSALLLASLRPPICVFAADAAAAELLSGQDRVTVYPWQEIALTPAYVLSDALWDAAKRINLRYASRYGGAEETAENKEALWGQLDGFTRYSNISAADYHDIQVCILKAEQEPTEIARMTPERLEQFSELEHMRWCRYHWLNNWRWGIPADGGRKDPAGRLHRDLVPYRDLTEEEKEKDRENVRILFTL